jgi:hypothetical protein
MQFTQQDLALLMLFGVSLFVLVASADAVVGAFRSSSKTTTHVIAYAIVFLAALMGIILYIITVFGKHF